VGWVGMELLEWFDLLYFEQPLVDWSTYTSSILKYTMMGKRLRKTEKKENIDRK
jgi:hypothetical protein